MNIFDGFNGFNGLNFFSLYGLISVSIVVIPNFIFAKKGQSTRPDNIDTAGVNVSLIELISRIIITVVLVCLRFPARNDLFGICAGVVLLIYFGLWARYFKDGCYYPDIYLKSFIGIPVPIDVFNILYLMFVSIWLSNSIAVGLTLIYGACRLLNARAALKDLKSRI